MYPQIRVTFSVLIHILLPNISSFHHFSLFLTVPHLYYRKRRGGRQVSP